ncbi:MAG: YicC family protein [Acidobacteria bacterium]|nr:YicC family protein [Acidobacteriota bacterium]
MTGFARVRRAIPQGEVVVSLKSVNHRGLDLHLHLPAELDSVENDVRAIVKGGVARGHVQVHAAISRAGGEGAGQLNRPLLNAYLAAFREASALLDVQGEPDINSALRVPGMLSMGEETEVSGEVRDAVLDAAREAVKILNEVRGREGAATAAELRQRCGTVCELVSRIEEIRAGAVDAFQKRLRERLAELLNGVGLDPHRLAQEAAILADRSDVSEELMRLKTHAGQLEGMLKSGGEVGKRLDFLLQEMNRESNTVLSKTGGLGDLGLTITELALNAKSEIDKIREQSLNLE